MDIQIKNIDERGNEIPAIDWTRWRRVRVEEEHDDSGELTGIVSHCEAIPEDEVAAEAVAQEREEAMERFRENGPERVGALETDVLDHDEAITGLYESMTQAQLDTDEALVSMYELMNGGI